MALVFKTPEDIASEYLTTLASLKPEVNIDQTDSDWWIRAQVIGGVISGVYADQQLLADDPFPQSARADALEKMLFTYFNSGFTPAQPSQGTVMFTGASGDVVPAGTQATYSPNGNVYQLIDDLTLTGATGAGVMQSVDSGQDQNLLSGAILTLSSPPPDIGTTATAITDFGDGRDIESNDEAAARLLARIRTPLAGGKVSDYISFALAADSSVVSANVLRYPFGLGTVGIVIKAGTTDVDAALNNGEPVVFMPSSGLIETVQAYIDTQRPVTDCATVLAPVEVSVDVSVSVRYVTGDNTTILSGQTLTNEQLVQREVQRAIYKTPTGGRQLGGSGFVVASDIEETIDLNLSGEPYITGSIIELLLDRRVSDLSATGPNFLIGDNQIAIPGNISVIEM